MVAAASGAGGQPRTNASSRKPLPELEMEKQDCLAVARERQLQSRGSSMETPPSSVERAVERAGVPQKLAANVREPVKKKNQKLKRIQKKLK